MSKIGLYVALWGVFFENVAILSVVSGEPDKAWPLFAIGMVCMALAVFVHDGSNA